jgi:tRNA (guanine-N7-)-methyltransferase
MTNPTPPGTEIRTYKLRRSRVSELQAVAISEYGEQYIYPDGDSQIDLAAELAIENFVIEIGFGMGEATWQYANAQSNLAVLAIDLHTPGIGKLINELQTRDLNNVRILEGDALEIIRKRIGHKSVDGIRLFFPDPWPKKRHFKRRFVNAENLALLANVVKPGGFFHFATDWQDYADWTFDELQNHADWELNENPTLGIWSNRPTTRFETKGVNLGRQITDHIAFRK